MKGQSSKRYVWGLFLTIIGGTGIAGIEIDSDVLFWIYAVILSVGIALCIAGYEE